MLTISLFNSSYTEKPLAQTPTVDKYCPIIEEASYDIDLTHNNIPETNRKPAKIFV